MNKISEPKADCVKISEDVISKIAETAVSGIEGVNGLATVKKSPASVLMRSYRQPVRIRISVSIVVSDSCNVRSAAEKIQKQVKEDVQNMTGIAVTKVSVYVKDIVFGTE